MLIRHTTDRPANTATPAAQLPTTADEWRHVAVRQNLGRSDTFSQIQTAYHADAADVRPRLPLVVSPVELDERYRRVQKRRPGSVVGNFEVVRQSAFFAIHASAAF